MARETVSCGGVVVYRGKFLLLFMNYYNRYEGWVLPKGTVETGESYEETAIREVKEESGATAAIIDYLGTCKYDYKTPQGIVNKTVNWYLMSGESFYSRPQGKEHFTDSGFYKYHEAYYLLKYDDERRMLELANEKYRNLKRAGLWEKSQPAAE